MLFDCAAVDVSLSLTVALISIFYFIYQDEISFGPCMTLYMTIEPVHLLPEVKC